MFTYLRSDLTKYKLVYQQSLEGETMYAPLVPTQTFDKEILTNLPREKRPDGIVDLRKLMENEEKPMKDMYETKIKELETEIKNIRSMEQTSSLQYSKMEAEKNKIQAQYNEQQNNIKNLARTQKADIDAEVNKRVELE